MSYYYLGQHKDNFIVLKQSHSFAEASDKLQVIDCSGRVNCEFEIEPDQYRRELMFSELGDGIIYCDNYFINTNTWDLIERSESSDLYAHEGSYFIAFGTTSWNFSYWSELDLNDVSSQSSYDSLYSAWRENKPEETEIDLDTFGEDDLSELGDLVLRYEYDDGVPILKDGCFCGSHLDPKDHGIDKKPTSI